MFKKVSISTIPNLCNKLTLLYILNALDIVFTFGLLKTGLFQEVNSLMVGVVTDPFLSVIIKLVIPALLIIYILFKLQTLDQCDLRICHFFLNFVLLIYTVITLFHISYFIFFLFTLQFAS